MLNFLFEKLKENATANSFTYAVVTDEMLKEAEKNMGIKLPEEYCLFLKEFGHGGIGGIEVLGVGNNGDRVFETETLKYREYGLPEGLIVIENCDEWVYCLNTDNGNVVMWCYGENGYSVVYDDFITYLRDRTEDVLENM